MVSLLCFSHTALSDFSEPQRSWGLCTPYRLEVLASSLWTSQFRGHMVLPLSSHLAACFPRFRASESFVIIHELWFLLSGWEAFKERDASLYLPTWLEWKGWHPSGRRILFWLPLNQDTAFSPSPMELGCVSSLLAFRQLPLSLGLSHSYDSVCKFCHLLWFLLTNLSREKYILLFVFFKRTLTNIGNAIWADCNHTNIVISQADFIIRFYWINVSVDR